MFKKGVPKKKVVPKTKGKGKRAKKGATGGAFDKARKQYFGLKEDSGKM